MAPVSQELEPPANPGRFRLLGDKAFDNNALQDELEKRGAEAVIPSKADRKQPISHDRDKYRWRHLIENYFNKIKDFRAAIVIALR
jgi:hypothetical protein